MSGASPSLGGWLLRDLVITLVFACLLAAAHLWNQAQSGWLSASAAVVVGFLTAYVACYLAHEWGHWAGARLSGSTIRIGPYKQPLLALVDTERHSHGQFLALSWGGIIGYALVTAAALASYFLWLPEAAGAGFAIGGLAFVSQSLSVDLPQVLKVHAGADPTTTNAEGANAAIILRRTWQSWSLLALALIAWAAL